MSNVISVRYYVVDSTTGKQIDTNCYGVPLVNTRIKEFLDLINSVRYKYYIRHVNTKSLLRALMTGQTDNVNTMCVSINEKDDNGCTALHYATVLGRYTDIVNILINAGAIVNAVDAFGCTALLYATVLGYTDIVDILINAGANTYAVELSD
jgi:hypothetical protein